MPAVWRHVWLFITMSVLVHETFDQQDWQDTWTGKQWNAYTTPTASQGPAGLRILFRKGSHYGCDLRQNVPPTRRVTLSYWLRVASDWNSHSTGKTVGFADLRHTDTKGRPLGHGNRPPRPDGFSFRTWFGKTVNGKVPVGMYVYHAGQKKRWGDTIPVGTLVCGAAHVLFRVEADLDEGVIRASLDGNKWVSHPIQVGADTAVTTAWLDGYYGGWRKSPANMAMDVDSFRLDDLSATPAAPPPVSEQVTETASRTAWAALPPRWTKRIERPVGHVFIHHGGVALDSHDTQTEAATIRAYQRHHYNKVPPWADIAYHFLVGVRSGRVYEGRGWRNRGAATRRWNNKSYAVCIIGDTDNQEPSDACVASIKGLLSHGVANGHIAAGFSLRGHRDVASTDCPGRGAYRLLAAMRPDAVPAAKVVAPLLGEMLRLRRPRMRGRLVRWVQNETGVTVDGVYGPLTKAAVEAYQLRHGLVGDGVVGPNTYGVMFRGD